MRLIALLASFLVAFADATSFAFTLAPAKLCPQQALYNTSMATWGGSVVEVPEDTTWRFHMFNGVYTRGCGVSYWRGNSAVVHLVSATPEGPFVFADEALPLWHTNPQVVRDPRDGTFVLFSIGQSVDPSQWTECDCTKSPACPPNAPPNPDYAGVVDVHYSSTAYGPWTQLLVNGSTVAMHGTNPAPAFLSNGTLVLGLNSEGTKVAVVHDWRVGPYVQNPTETLPYQPATAYEDPFLFQWGGKWRQLVHQYPLVNSRPAPQFATGGYGENVDVGDVFAPWVYGGLTNPAYTNNVTYVDGSIQTLHRRERPKLLFTLDGRAWLYTAVQSPLNASRDFSFTHVQEVLAMSP